ncbi:DGQHR domain-containing protein [Flavobacterium rhamnosiphilum]|uniref:DGQHR domain-containing protein n=1 Tax=Flavobacterium rhamnosiphilum TaxID=2541724 RepID=A0A4R5F4R5_9FLAO|nr:DGQHR domain-containing protein [Flavobacterium rhamnosiphilum]TDE42224.1 DGQHR domain-containing protein [Flavobacterium rhamnosiphilum]
MAFLDQFQIDTIKGKIIDDLSNLGKTYKSKKGDYQQISVDHSRVEDYTKQGWEEYAKPLKTKTLLRKVKDHSKKFEDDVWCQFYELGFRKMNYDENLILPFSKNIEDTKQIDLIAINEETIFIIECKSSESFKKAPSYKDEFDLLSLRLDGFKKSLRQIYGNHYKIKFIFATRNLRFDPESIDLSRLKTTNSFFYDNNTYSYVNSLIKNYKSASLYQFLGLVFKNELINLDKIEIPAVKGLMGNKKYYMFSIEPHLLLKMGFILHRTKANVTEFPTYQRLLVPSRLKGITKFIDDGGYFPNSIIVNFNSSKHKVQFESSSKLGDSNSCFGTLKIPNSYGITYIIDGQHRVYGYAGSKFAKNNTIPVVAFDGLETIEQLEIFMDINQNQKAVSPSLRLDLEEDLYWESERADSRIKALRSSIIKQLSNSESSPLFNKISVGEDKAILTFKPFTAAIANSHLLPSAQGNKYNEGSLIGSLYDTNNHDHNQEMIKAKKKIVEFIIHSYDYVEQEYPNIYNREKYFILSNRGTFAFISLIGDLNKFETQKGNLSKQLNSSDRFLIIKPYLKALLDGLSKLTKEEEDNQLTLLGAGADTKWLRYFQSIVNSVYPDYNPSELIDWKERQNEEYQTDGRKYVKEIERFMKKTILTNLKILFGDNWELEIETIQSACILRANAENKKNYKDGLSKRVEWTEMFNINDYNKIIEDYWSKRPEINDSDYITFEKTFSIDIGVGKNKKEVLKWISYFNSYRNQLAHEGSKEKGINKKEVDFLEKIHNHFYK